MVVGFDSVGHAEDKQCVRFARIRSQDLHVPYAPQWFGPRNGTLRVCDGLLLETTLLSRPLLLRIGILEFVEVWHVDTQSALRRHFRVAGHELILVMVNREVEWITWI